jgi:bile acid:Na+ symporter, BASS family
MDGLSQAGQVALMAAVFGVMITTGMAIDVDDFRRLTRRPRAVAVGIGSQLLLLPAAGFALAWAFSASGVGRGDVALRDLVPLLAVGIVLLAATPGGAGSNFIIHAVDGDRALSVSLTAISSVLAFVTIPIYLALAFDVFVGKEAAAVGVPIRDVVLNVALLTVIPVAIGMGIRRRRRALAERLEAPSKVLAAIVIGVIIVGVVIDSWEVITAFFGTLAPVVVGLNLAALTLGLLAARGARLRRRESVTISVETGVQNSPLAITLALTVIGEPALSIPAGLFGLTMLVTATLVAGLGRRWVAAEPAPQLIKMP